MRGFYVLLLILLLVFPSKAQDTTYPLEELEDQEYNFQITLNADYTNHISTSMLITVESELERSFAISITGENNSEGVWISGLEQTSVLTSVDIGILYNSGFNASSDPERKASVAPFNMTVLQPSNYSTNLKVDNVSFSKDHDLNVTLIDNSTVMSPFLSIPVDYFSIDSILYIEAYASKIRDIVDQVNLEFDLSAEVSDDEDSISYSVSGSMPDIHQFSYHDRIRDIEDYNTIDVQGDLTFNFDNHVLSEYNENYEIQYEDITILQYSLTINVRPGSGGNIIIGGNQLPELLWPFIIIGAVVLVFLTRYLTKRYG